jgi:hypothetical protein
MNIASDEQHAISPVTMIGSAGHDHTHAQYGAETRL